MINVLATFCLAEKISTHIFLVELTLSFIRIYLEFQFLAESPTSKNARNACLIYAGANYVFQNQ